MTISPRIRTSIYERDGNFCVACGTQNELTIHHRVNRGSGGSKLFDSKAFLLTMCNFCNTRMESDADFRELALVYGWKLLRNTKPPIDPTTVAVKYTNSGEWFLLDNEGKRKQVTHGK